MLAYKSIKMENSELDINFLNEKLEVLTEFINETFEDHERRRTFEEINLNQQQPTTLPQHNNPPNTSQNTQLTQRELNNIARNVQAIQEIEKSGTTRINHTQ